MIYDDAPPKATWVEAFRNASSVSKTYLLLVLLHATLLTFLSIFSLDDPNIDDVYGFDGVFISLCFIGFSFQGVLKDNVVQLRCAILSACLFTLYLVWFLFRKERALMIIIITIISGLFCFSYIILYKHIVDGFGWYRYNRLNFANEDLLNLYYTFQVFKAMIFLDVEMTSICWILIVVNLYHTPLGTVAQILCWFFEIGWAFLGLKAIRSENMLLTKIFIFLSLGLFIYIGINMYWILSTKHYINGTSPNQNLVALGLTLIVRCFFLYWVIRAVKNFHLGLVAHIFNAGIENMDIWGSGDNNNGQIQNSDATSSYHRLNEESGIGKPKINTNDDIDNDNDQSNNDDGSKLGSELSSKRHHKASSTFNRTRFGSKDFD